MRIALVAPLVTPIREPQLGGSQALLADIAAGLASRGHDVDVFAASGSVIAGVNVIETGVDSSVLRSTLFRAGTEQQSGAEADAAFAAVYARIRPNEYDVIHNHAFDAPAVERAPDGPVVHTLHLPPDPSIASALARARRRIPPPTVVCVSRSQLRAWSRLIDVDLVVTNGVPVDRIAWLEDVPPESPALFAGRFSPEKGAAEAIEIATRAGVALVLVGHAYDRSYADDRIEPHRHRPGLDIREPMTRSELWELMARSSAVLCPVQWDEPYGLVAAEAQAAGTPVVAFRRGALPDIVVDGVTGRLVEDVDSAAEALQAVASLDRRACRAHAAEALSLAVCLDAHEALYRRVVAATNTAAQP